MAINSINFLLFAVAVIVLSNCFPSAAGRRTVLACASILFITSYANTILQLMPLAFFVVVCFGVVRAVQARPSSQALLAGLTLILLCFIYLKRVVFVDSLPALSFVYTVVGLSYILFRVIHLVVDIEQGTLQDKIGPVVFFNYTCNFLSFVSGPIQRYQDYAVMDKGRLDLNDEKVFSAFSRIVRGFIKVAVISAIANYIFELLSTRLVGQSAAPTTVSMALLFAATAIIYTVYLYYNFAGYMDIVIGIGWMIGFDLPENFDKPFSSRNFLEFWSRWHITLSDWFKTYIFNPLMKYMVAHVRNVAAQPVLGVIAFFVTFLLMGMWHGVEIVFLIYGLMMGAGASVNKLWQLAMSRIFGKKRYKALSEDVFYTYLCTGMTCAWFALALTCFWANMQQLSFLIRSLGILGILLTFATVTMVSGIALGVTRWLSGLVAPMTYRLKAYTHGLAARNLLLGGRVMIIATVASFFHRAPEFVYRAF